MNRLEKYISSNQGAFDTAGLPEGSREVFICRIQRERRKANLRKTIVLTFGSIAASAAIVLSLMPRGLEHEIRNHHKRLAMKEAEILTAISAASPEDLDEVVNTIRSVTFEAVPLEDQLPDELGDRGKREILDEYYSRKHTALEEILNLYTQIN